MRRRAAQDVGVVGLALDAVVPGAVVVGAVAVVLAVGLVVLVLVGHQVAQGEAVVRGDEVDRRERPAAVVGVEVRRAGEPVAELRARRCRRLAPRQKSRTVSRYWSFHSVHRRRELADLVAAGTDVPRLGDQLHLRSTGSCWIAGRNVAEHVDVVRTTRASAEARSKRKPSTCISCTQ